MYWVEGGVGDEVGDMCVCMYISICQKTIYLCYVVIIALTCASKWLK